MLARWDWLPETTRLAGLAKTWGDDVIRGLAEKGFNEAKMLKMTKAGIDLKVINARLAPLFEDYPGIEAFFRNAKVFEIDDSTVLLKGRTNTIDLKALGTTQNPHETTRILLTIKSGYTQILMEQKCVDEGWNILSNAKRFNSPGYDLVAEKDGIIKLMEAKSGNALSWDNFKNYFHKLSYSDTNTFSFNRKYFMKNSGYEDSEIIREAYKWGKIKIEVFVNNPQSDEIVKHLFDEVYLNTGEPFSAYYKNLNNAPRHVEVTFTTVHQ